VALSEKHGGYFDASKLVDGLASAFDFHARLATVRLLVKFVCVSRGWGGGWVGGAAVPAQYCRLPGRQRASPLLVLLVLELLPAASPED
jgi:hypothetical protein